MDELSILALIVCLNFPVICSEIKYLSVFITLSIVFQLFHEDYFIISFRTFKFIFSVLIVRNN